MLRQIWHVLALLLLLNFPINAQNENTTVSSSPPDVEQTTTTTLGTTLLITTTHESTTSSDGTTTHDSATTSDGTTTSHGTTPSDGTTTHDSTTPSDGTTTSHGTTTSDGTTTHGSTTSSDSTTTSHGTTTSDGTITSDGTTTPTATTALPITTTPESTTKSESTTSSDGTTTSHGATTSDGTTTHDSTTTSGSTTKPESGKKPKSTTTSTVTTALPNTTTIANDAITSTFETSTSIIEETTVTITKTTRTPISKTTVKNEQHTTTTKDPQSRLTGSSESNSNDHTTITLSESTTATQITKLPDVENYYPHSDKPQWLHVEPSQPIFIQNDITSLSDIVIRKIILELADYINLHLNKNIDRIFPSLKTFIANELAQKLDHSQLNIHSKTVDGIHGTVTVLVKNLPVIIDTTMFSMEKVANEKCTVEAKFLDNVYCLNFELNSESSFIPTTPSSDEISVKSFKIFNTISTHTAASAWDEWHHSPTFDDQKLSTNAESVVVCYYTNWAQYRSGPGRFYPENMDPNLCTHILYAFAQLRDDVIVPYEWNDESTQWSTGMYARMMGLRRGGKQPKILLALGGWNHGSGKFSDMARDDTKRAAFIKSTVDYLQKHKFDGLDIDWEYPGSREGSRPTDKRDYTKLLTELKKAFRPLNLLLTAAVGAGKPTIDAAYDIPEVCNILDLVNLMSYDLHGSWESTTGIHVALYGRQSDTELNKQLTQDWAIRYWIKNGCPASKIVMGLALYGRTFRLASSTDNKIGAAAVGPGAAGLYTGTAGFLSYYEICTRVQQNDWTKVFDDEQKSNYAYKGQEWVGYDDIYSIGFKVQYAKDKGLAGLMFWAPDLDDFTGGLCNQGKYPLMNAAVKQLRDRIEWTPLTAASTRPTPTTTASTPEQGKRVVCYYTNWAQYRPDGGKFLPNNLDASLCTHINYAFAVLKDSKLAPFEFNDEDTDWSTGMYSRVLELKKTNNVKVLLSVGGWEFGSGKFSDLVKNEKLRETFVAQATQFLRDHKFDGLDVDWEYPGSREGSRPEDKKLFTTLLEELKEAFEPYNLLLTAAVAAGASNIEAGYEIDKIAEHLDFINLMTYDLHGGSWENFTGLPTAMFARPGENSQQITLNQDWAINYWIDHGMPSEKISMGLGTYGRTFKLVNSADTGIGAPSSGPGDAGKYTKVSGFLSYYEICEKLNSGLWTSKYDDVQKSMYAYGEGMWVGYDNVDTLTIRANYIIEKKLGGAMIWAPDLDDFSGNFCNRGRYPLMNTVVNLLRTGTTVPLIIPTVPTSTVTIATETTTTATVATETTTTATIATTTTTTTLFSFVSPSVHVSSPAVVCMTTVNALVFQTLNVKLCTHLIIVQSNVFSTDTDQLGNKGSDAFSSTLPSNTLNQLKIMKTTNPKLKILYSILSQWKPEHLNLIRDDRQRKIFTQRTQEYLVENSLDGLDIHWDIPSDAETVLTDKFLLSTWLIELRDAFASNRLLLSLGISGNKLVLDSSYEFNRISKTVDFIRLMAFDWAFGRVTGLIDPLFFDNSLSADYRFYNINFAVNYVVSLGIPLEKISLGIPTYARLFTLVNSNLNRIGSPTTGSSITVGYSDICKLLKSDGYITKYVEQLRASYAFNLQKKQWISFNSVNDVKLKARFAQLAGLGGVTLSSLGTDNIDGRCGSGPYPLLHAVASIFNPQATDESSIMINASDSRRDNILQKTRIFCSVSSKASSYYGSIRFTWDKINANLCTHLLIDNTDPQFSSSVSDLLKKTNPDLKIILSINYGEDLDADDWKDDLQDKKADSINIQIGSNTFSANITDQIKKIRSTLTNIYPLSLSFEMPTDSSHQVSFFNLLNLHNYVDYIILLPFGPKSIEAFDNLQPWNSLNSFVTADPSKNIGDYSMLSAYLFILASGVPKEKLIMSIPTYGLSFLLDEDSAFQLGRNISAQGFPGPITHTKGQLASYEICDLIRLNNYQRFLSNESVTTMAHKEDNLVIFDDTQPTEFSGRTVSGTVELKATFIRNAQLAGVLVHSIDMDDYTGQSCRRGVYPITSIVNGIFAASTVPSVPSTTLAPIVQTNGVCSGVKKQGLVADEKDCHFYYVCLPTDNKPVAYLKCPANMYFSIKQQICVQEKSPCSSLPKPNLIKESSGAFTTPSPPIPNKPFICPIANGIFPDLSDCTKFLACSNYNVIQMKCPLGTKFNTRSNRCDWLSMSCP